MDKDVKLGVGFSAFKPASPAAVAKPAAKKPAEAPAAKSASIKGTVDKNLKNAAKTTDTVCADITKKLLGHKNAALPEITDIGGLKKDDMLKMVELLDAMGSTTYRTVCALRELVNKMQ